LPSIATDHTKFLPSSFLQNWSHVSDLFELLNRLPTQQRDTDFSRVRPWYARTALMSHECLLMTSDETELPHQGRLEATHEP
jgi:hypothetical protein